MEFIVSYHCYRSWGWHSTISLLAGFLEMDCPDFGSALKEIKIHVYFRSDGKPRRLSEEKQRQKFDDSLDQLPRTIFFRKKKRFQIRYESRLANATQIIDWNGV